MRVTANTLTSLSGVSLGRFLFVAICMPFFILIATALVLATHWMLTLPASLANALKCDTGHRDK
jgi:hypothetical protein